ncbi:MAG: tetratricopeptide repeat protein, partial [Bdellovibrio sp.]
MTRIVLFFSFLIFTFSLQAIEKMDLNTTNLVIQKLEKSLQGLKLEEIKNEALLSRLGDLYSEKARLLFLQEEEQRCESSCEGSQKARLKAIRFYQKVLKGRDHVLKTRAMFQMAYLYQVTGQSLKAKSVYHNILKSRKYSKGLKAQAHVALGDVYFQEKNYKKALEHFNQALQFPGLLKKGDVLHKKAWALFFLGKTQKAQQLLVHLLKRMDVVGLAQGHQLDQAFYEEVLRDLTTFLAKTPITSQKIKLLLSLTPDRLQKSTLFFLAQESERLGQRRSALLIWNQYQSYFQLKTDEKAFVDFRKARLYYEFNQYALSLKFFKKALASLKKSSCRSDECALLKGQIKDYVILWNKEFRTRPNTLLLQVNQTYLKTFPDDFSILLQSAKIAQTLKSWKKAITLYRQISEKTNDKKILSLSLWGEIECAENSGDYELRKQAYQHFLEVQPKDPRAYEVRYQMAHLSFEKKDYKKAYLQFLKLALASSQERKQNKKLSVLAADLTVLSLQFLKDDSTLEDVSQRLAAYYPKKRKSFLKIATEAKVRQAVQVNNKKKKAKPEELLEAYKKIVRPFGLSSKKQMKVAFLRLSLAEKAHQLTLVEKESRQLLKRELNAKDKHFVQERLLWALELQLKFKAAYALAKNMRFPYLSLEDRELRLALLSELAGQNPQKHYQNIFRKGRSLLKRNLALVEIIRRSRRPW